MDHEKILEAFAYCLKVAEFPEACKVKLLLSDLRYERGCSGLSQNLIKSDGCVAISVDATLAICATPKRVYEVLLHEIAHAALQYSSVDSAGHTAYFLALVCLFYRRFDARNSAEVPLLELIDLYDQREESLLSPGQSLDFALAWSKENMNKHDDAVNAAETAFAAYTAHCERLENDKAKAARGVAWYRVVILFTSTAAVVSTSALAALLLH
jgi:hypothetical protein